MFGSPVGSAGNTDDSTFSLEPSPEVFNAVLCDFLQQLALAFPHRKDELMKAKQRMDYLTTMNAGAVMNYFKGAMQPFETQICQLDTGFLVTGLPQIRLLQGKVSPEDLLKARPEDRFMCSQFLRDLYLLSVGPKALPEEMMAEVDKVVGALTEDKESLQALSSAFDQIMGGGAPSEADMALLQGMMKQHGLPGLPGM